MELENSGGISRNFDKPILKDSIMMPVGGYVIGRFRADNPGTLFAQLANHILASMCNGSDCPISGKAFYLNSRLNLAYINSRV